MAIVAVGAEVARSSVTGLFQFAALININLAVVNILPLPALDGAPRGGAGGRGCRGGAGWVEGGIRPWDEGTSDALPTNQLSHPLQAAT